MNVNIVTTTDNKLLERKEIEAQVSFDAATPKRAEIKQAISGKIGANPDFMVLRKVESYFGKKMVWAIAYSYPSKEKLMANEPKYIKIREGLLQKEEKKKAPAPAKKKV